MANTNYLYANNAESTLLGALGPTDVTITLPSGHGARFPTTTGGAVFLLTIEDVSGNIEIVQCTARVADTLTVVRGREGTLAAAWTASTGIFHRLTAGVLAQIDWTKFAGVANGVATLDGTTKIPIAQFNTPLQTFCDARYNLSLGYTPVNKAGDTMTGNLTTTGLIAAASTGEVDIFMRYGGSLAHQMYFANTSGFFTLNYTDAAGAYLGGAMTVNNTTGVTYFSKNLGVGGSPAGSLDVYTTNGRVLVRTISSLTTIDCVTPTNSAYAPLNFTSTAFTFTGGSVAIATGGISVTGGSTITTSGSTASLTIHDTGGTANLRFVDSTGLAKTVRANNSALEFVNNAYSAVVTSMSDGGNWNMSGTVTAASVIDNSDIRIKDNIVPMSFDDALDIVLRTQVVRFFNKKTGRDDFGVVADDQANVTPELVFEGNDPEKLKGVAYSRLAAPLIVVLQGLRARGII